MVGSFFGGDIIVNADFVEIIYLYVPELILYTYHINRSFYVYAKGLNCRTNGPSQGRECFKTAYTDGIYTVPL